MPRFEQNEDETTADFLESVNKAPYMIGSTMHDQDPFGAHDMLLFDDTSAADAAHGL